ncbi:deoxycytidylate deaminase [Tateyamaria sp.]|uniref:deoxycytidylate deaminase n=1 Tax=Tateyamaria sp. TaxID=1929288 RepID=UPI0032A0351E
MVNIHPAITTVVSPTQWDHRFFSMAHLIGSWSEDKGRKVGAIIVGQAQEVRSIGFNGLPRGVSDAVDQRYSKENGEKYYWFEHAERNAIYNAARVGIATGDCELYSTLFPCSDCLRAIVQSGIKILKTYAPPDQDAHYKRSFEVSLEIAHEAGLKVFVFEPRSLNLTG